MAAAIEELARQAGAGRTVAILGDMLELGPDEAAYHRALGGQASTAGVTVLITVGPRAAEAAETFEGECHPVADAGEAAALATELIASGDTVLVKGSRGVGLEFVVEALRSAVAA
jgi:UDP-N-acetylmuramoyl-tripeptide--D-alanyl-D-alanine ligase